MKKKLLVVALVVAMILSVTACGGEEGTSGGSGESSVAGKETVSESGIGSGKVEAKLSLTSENKIEVWNHTSDYFQMYSEDKSGELLFMNAKGEIQEYVNDETGIRADGYQVSQKNYDKEQGEHTLVLKDNQEVLRINQAYIGGWDYRDGVLYYTDQTNQGWTNWETVAYDLVKGKELWRVAGESPSLQGDVILLVNEYAREAGEDRFYSKIVDLEGNTIAESTEEYAIWPTASNYYIKTRDNEYVEVYDLENNKISELSLVSASEDMDIHVTEVLDNGMFVIQEWGEDASFSERIERLYDINGNLLKECSYMSDIGNHMIECDDMREGFFDSVLIINDTAIVDEVWEVKSVASGVEEKYFAMVEKRDATGDYDSSTTHICNLMTGESMLCETKMWERFEQSPDGNYFIVKDEEANQYQVYNGEFEKLYEGTDDRLWPVDGEYVLEDGEKLFLIHIASGEKTELKVKGNHSENNRFGIVTYDGEKFYLYALGA